MKRTITKKYRVPDPNTGQIKVIENKIPFYNQNLRTCAVLKPSQMEYTLFKAVEPSYLRNYTSEKNPFPNGEGEFIALKANFLSPDQSVISVNNGSLAILQALSVIRNAGTLVWKVADEIIAKEQLSVIMPPIPWLVAHTIKGNPTDAVLPPPALIDFESQSNWMERSHQTMISFRTPIPVKTSENVELVFKIEKDPNKTLPPEIDGYILEFLAPSNIFTKGSEISR
ncbi:hypothetical protein [Leptospira stimsonii]|uniref:Uncharacterized protein n=1 Tax=Leptospira stimsonii TaxID=2202203 RepID=A0ABY2MV63_9LEPT|nr:hypothetical protein [Leptospira stimsonii]TGK25383.1 hypothetical protein EHO98_03005 [Leptospira stimsonii]TGM08802.1 hypothetical protein EHQ90_22190 [Leptospira stimsonii]